ncbi:hypothetical protein PFDG_05120, partial [Plasmodium falciparum Dd2]
MAAHFKKVNLVKFGDNREKTLGKHEHHEDHLKGKFGDNREKTLGKHEHHEEYVKGKFVDNREKTLCNPPKMITQNRSPHLNVIFNTNEFKKGQSKTTLFASL